MPFVADLPELVDRGCQMTARRDQIAVGLLDRAEQP